MVAVATGQPPDEVVRSLSTDFPSLPHPQHNNSLTLDQNGSFRRIIPANSGIPLAVLPLTATEQTGHTLEKQYAQAIQPSTVIHGSTSPSTTLNSHLPTPLPFKQVTYLHGEPTFKFEQTEIDVLVLRQNLKWAVIGKFSHGMPDIEFLRTEIPKQLKLKACVNIGYLCSRHVLIRCSIKEDYDVLMSINGSFDIKKKNVSHPMRSMKWEINFDPTKETSIAWAWISFPNLPPNYFEESTLLSFASAVGRPICVDKATINKTRPSCARVKVEVDLLREHPTQFQIQIGKNEDIITKSYKIEFDFLPKYCTKCCLQGHDKYGCWKLDPSLRPSKEMPTPPLPPPIVKPTLPNNNPDTPKQVPDAIPNKTLHKGKGRDNQKEWQTIQNNKNKKPHKNTQNRNHNLLSNSNAFNILSGDDAAVRDGADVVVTGAGRLAAGVFHKDAVLAADAEIGPAGEIEATAAVFDEAAAAAASASAAHSEAAAVATTVAAVDEAAAAATPAASAATEAAVVATAAATPAAAARHVAPVAAFSGSASAALAGVAGRVPVVVTVSGAAACAESADAAPAPAAPAAAATSEAAVSAAAAANFEWSDGGNSSDDFRITSNAEEIAKANITTHKTRPKLHRRAKDATFSAAVAADSTADADASEPVDTIVNSNQVAINQQLDGITSSGSDSVDTEDEYEDTDEEEGLDSDYEEAATTMDEYEEEEEEFESEEDGEYEMLSKEIQRSEKRERVIGASPSHDEFPIEWPPEPIRVSQVQVKNKGTTPIITSSAKKTRGRPRKNTVSSATAALPNRTRYR